MATTPLVLPPNFTENQKQLADCFLIVDPMDGPRGKMRSSDLEPWRRHDFKIITTTSKGAGGTGKTSTACTVGVGLVQGILGRPAHNVLLVNADSQASLEDRMIGKLVDTVYNGEMNYFKELNNLVTGQQQPSDLLEGLQSCMKADTDYRLVAPRLIQIDCGRLSAKGYNARQSECVGTHCFGVIM